MIENPLQRSGESVTVWLPRIRGQKVKRLSSSVKGVMKSNGRPELRGKVAMKAQQEENNQSARCQKLLQSLESEHLLLQTLIDNVPDLIFQKDREGRYVLANRSLANVVGLSDPKDMIGKTNREVFPREVAERFTSNDRVVIETAQPYENIEEPVLSTAGSLTWLLATRVPLRDKTGRVTGIIGIGRDITKRKELEKKNQQLATLVESSDDAIVGLDLNRRITVWNRGAEHLYGYTAEEIIGARTSLIIPSELEDEARLMREQVMRGEQVRRYETTRLRKDGSRVMVSLTLSAIRDAEGRIVGMASTASDVTEYNQAEVALQESERQLTNIVDFLPDATLAIDKGGRVIIWNKAIEKMTGIPAAKMIGKGDHASTIPFYGEAPVQLLDVVLKDCEEIPIHYSTITREGEALSGEVFCNALYNNTGAWVFVKASPLRDQSGNIIGAIESIRDITDFKRAQEVLQQSERRLSDIVDFLPDATFAIDTEGTITAWNRAMERTMGTTKAQMLGCRNHEYAIPFYGYRRPILIDLAFDSREEIEKEYIFVEKRGDTLIGEAFTPSLHEGKGAHVWGIATLLRNEKGMICGAIESVRDITEQRKAESEVRRLQEQLLQAQKMEAIGRLAGGVAHDFNNLLTAILGNVELIKAKDLERGTIAEIADEIQKAGLRAAALTQQLLAFSRKQMLQPKVLDLNGLVENLSKMLRRLIGEDIKLELRLDGGLGSVRADPGQIEQVILNLAVNARDAMSVGGRLVLETRNAASSETFGPGRLDIPPGPYVILTVSDNGAGMDETVKERIFEPFFTTKELGKGTGLGLSTVYGIVKQSGGYIFVDSEPGHGTVFSIFLPQVDTEEASREASPIERRPNGGTERILLVEDEPSVLHLSTRMLEGFGYTVTGVLTPGEALSLPTVVDGRGVNLLITDMVLPGMKGTELARRLQERSPDLRVLFISGYTDERTFRDGVLADGNAFLPKPFSENVLGRKVREVLDSHRPT
jgi:PAS domain S-box-containing protein